MSDRIVDKTDRPAGEDSLRWLSVVEDLLACARRVRDQLACYAAGSQLSTVEFWLMWACGRGPADGCGQSELAARLGVSAAQVSGLVEKFRRRGLLDSRRDQTDRRRQLWRLTPEGQRRLQAVLTELSNWADRLDRRLGAEGSQRLADLLSRLQAAQMALDCHRQRGAA